MTDDTPPPFDGGPRHHTDRIDHRAAERDRGTPNETGVSRRDTLQLLAAGVLAGGSLASLSPVARAESRIQKLTASDGGSFDQFGDTIALDGDTAIVGASNADTDAGEDAGAAYVFTRDSDGSWGETQVLHPADAQPDERFGAAVALAGDQAIVGATDGTDGESGAAYVFTRDTDETWRESQTLTASDASGNDDFGIAIALSGDGDTALIGALGAEVDGVSSGAAYVFTHDGDSWSETKKLSASDPTDGDAFGNFEAVALDRDGTTALVGDGLKQDASGDPVGAAYVFQRDDGAWTEVAELTAEDEADTTDLFGTAVALDDAGTTAVVGATFDDVDLNEGAVYVFADDGSEWTRTTRLTASDGHRLDSLGFPVTLSGNGTALLAGARHDDDKGTDAGSAYLFTQDSGAWTEPEKFTASDPEPTDEYGSGLAISAGTGFVGAAGDDNDNGTSAGAVYVYDDLITDVVPSLEIGDLRPVQTVEATTLQNPAGDDEPVSPAVPDFVAGRNMSILFSLHESRNVGVLTDTASAVVTVTREYTTRVETDTFELEFDALLPLLVKNTNEANVFDVIGGPDGPPVFEATEDLVEIRVGITAPDASAAEFSGDTATIHPTAGRDLVETDPLTVGFIEIGDPTGGDNYGDSDGHIKDNFDTLVTKVTDNYAATFPVAEVDGYDHPDRLEDPSVIGTKSGTIVEDMKSARKALEDEFEDVDFDVTVAFVPEGYPGFHGDGFLGKHLSGVSAAAVVRGDLRLDKGVGELHTTSAQEIGHHFLGDVYPKKLSMRQKGGGIDNSHARTEPDGTNNTPDDTYLDSTGFDFRDGQFASPGGRLESFMSYNFDDYPMWADTHEYQAMLDGGLDGHPSSSDSGRSEPLVEGVGRLAAADTTTFTRVFLTEGVPTESSPDAAVTVRVLDAAGEEIDSRTVPDELESHRRTPETNRSHGTETDVFAFAVPFPETAAAVEAERDGTVTRLNPVERSLRAAIDRLPDDAFTHSPDDRRAALDDKLDDVDEMMAERKYRPAKRKLQRDVRDKLEKWLRDDYDTSALQPTKEELLALVADMIARLEALADAA